MALEVNNPPTNKRHRIPGPGRSPGGENGYSLQCFCLESPMDRTAWRLQSTGTQRVTHDWATGHTVTHRTSNGREYRHVSENQTFIRKARDAFLACSQTRLLAESQKSLHWIDCIISTSHWKPKPWEDKSLTVITQVLSLRVKSFSLLSFGLLFQHILFWFHWSLQCGKEYYIKIKLSSVILSWL